MPKLHKIQKARFTLVPECVSRSQLSHQIIRNFIESVSIHPPYFTTDLKFPINLLNPQSRVEEISSVAWSTRSIRLWSRVLDRGDCYLYIVDNVVAVKLIRFFPHLAMAYMVLVLFNWKELLSSKKVFVVFFSLCVYHFVVQYFE